MLCAQRAAHAVDRRDEEIWLIRGGNSFLSSVTETTIALADVGLVFVITVSTYYCFDWRRSLFHHWRRPLVVALFLL